MSWSKSASGNADQVKNAMLHWPEEQDANDRQGSLNEAAIKGHHDQIVLVGDTVDAFLNKAPDGAQFIVTGYGHHNGTDKGNVGLSVSYSFPGAK